MGAVRPLAGDILALDIATHTGWALGKPGTKVIFGTVDFSGGSQERRFARAYDWTISMIAEHRPGILIFEAPLPTNFTRGKTNEKTARLLTGLVGAMGAAYIHAGLGDDQIWDATVGDVRGHFLGNKYRNAKREIAKDMTKRKCIDMGYAITNDNEADAIALHSYMSSLLKPETAMEVTPLFAEPGHEF